MNSLNIDGLQERDIRDTARVINGLVRSALQDPAYKIEYLLMGGICENLKPTHPAYIKGTGKYTVFFRLCNCSNDEEIVKVILKYCQNKIVKTVVTGDNTLYIIVEPKNILIS